MFKACDTKGNDIYLITRRRGTKMKKKPYDLNFKKMVVAKGKEIGNMTAVAKQHELDQTLRRCFDGPENYIARNWINWMEQARGNRSLSQLPTIYGATRCQDSFFR